MTGGVRFRSRFTLQANATVRPPRQMDEALMKSIGRCELAPESHRVTNIASGNIRAGFGRHYSIALDAKTIGAGTLVFLFPVNGKIPSRGRFGGDVKPAALVDHATVPVN